MFKLMIKIANTWVVASENMPRARARRLAGWYRTNSENVTGVKVVRSQG